MTVSLTVDAAGGLRCRDQQEIPDDIETLSGGSCPYPAHTGGKLSSPNTGSRSTSSRSPAHKGSTWVSGNAPTQLICGSGKSLNSALVPAA